LKEEFTTAQTRLKTVWKNPSVACICSQMPNMKIMTANVAAAMNQTKLSKENMNLLQH
jgi:hypothetical protein